MKIKKIRKLSAPKKTSTLLSSAKKFDDKRKAVASKQKSTLSISQAISLMKNLIKTHTSGLSLKDFFDYADKKRVDRAKKQLKVYFLNSFKKGVFNFVVKSSGLNEPESYNVRVQFKKIDEIVEARQHYIKHDEFMHDMKIGVECSCDDFKYRFRYWLTQMDSLPDGALKEHRFPKKTNPNSEHLFLCKHSILVLNGMNKPSFRDNIFKRYLNNLVEKGKNTVRVEKKDKRSTYLASHKTKIKES